MTRVLHRSLTNRPPVAKGAHGVQIIDSEGRRYIDACGGAAVSSLGHGHPDVLTAMRTQLDSIPYAHSGFFTTEVAEALAADLIEHAPSGLTARPANSGGLYRGDHILIAPPFIADAPVIDRIVERLSDAIDAAMASVTMF